MHWVIGKQVAQAEEAQAGWTLPSPGSILPRLISQKTRFLFPGIPLPLWPFHLFSSLMTTKLGKASLTFWLVGGPVTIQGHTSSLTSCLGASPHFSLVAQHSSFCGWIHPQLMPTWIVPTFQYQTFSDFRRQEPSRLFHTLLCSGPKSCPWASEFFWTYVTLPTLVTTPTHPCSCHLSLRLQSCRAAKPSFHSKFST